MVKIFTKYLTSITFYFDRKKQKKVHLPCGDWIIVSCGLLLCLLLSHRLWFLFWYFLIELTMLINCLCIVHLVRLLALLNSYYLILCWLSLLVKIFLRKLQNYFISRDFYLQGYICLMKWGYWFNGLYLWLEFG